VVERLLSMHESQCQKTPRTKKSNIGSKKQNSHETVKTPVDNALKEKKT
jgi:hypothetical protein